MSQKMAAASLKQPETAHKQESEQALIPTDVLKHLRTSAQGLSSVQAQQRLNEVGPNEPSNVKQRPALLQFLLNNFLYDLHR